MLQMRMTNMLINAIEPLAEQQAYAQKDKPAHQQQNVYADLLKAFKKHKAYTLDAEQQYDETHPCRANAIGREVVASKVFGQYVIDGDDMSFDSRVIDPKQMDAVVAAARQFFHV